MLIIGGNNIRSLKEMVNLFGTDNVTHISARKHTSVCKKEIPQKTECILMLTDYLSHNVMHKYKKEAKKRNIPVVYSKRSSSSVFCALCKLMGNDKNCPKND